MTYYVYIGKCEDGRYWFIWGNALYFTYVTVENGRRRNKTVQFVKLNNLTKEVLKNLPKKVVEVLKKLGFVKNIAKLIGVKLTEVDKAVLSYMATCTKVFQRVMSRFGESLYMAMNVAFDNAQIFNCLRSFAPEVEGYLIKRGIDIRPLRMEFTYYMEPKDMMRIAETWKKVFSQPPVKKILEEKIDNTVRKIYSLFEE